MNRNAAFLLFALVAIIALGIYVYGRSADTAPTDDPRADFVEEGNLVINSAGLPPEVWHLIYEKEGRPALAQALVFDRSSMCGTIVCEPTVFEQGVRVRIEGVKEEAQVRVRTLTITEPDARSARILLYFYNPARDKDGAGNVQCSRAGLVAVERIVPETETPIEDAIRLLLRGELSDEERARGITTEFPLEGVQLRSTSLEAGALTLVFDDPNSKTSGGACRAGILWFQIETTAKQFDTVEEVHFAPEELFQP